jgi:serine/threonine protein kinase
MLAPNTLLQNRYLIVRSIGHGGMGAVYLARDQRLGHTVALKETFFTEERMRRAFEREARLLAHLRHPALPKVTDHFDEDGGQFIVMEFIAGDDLEILLAQRGESFPVGQVLAWGDELLKALDYLHNQDPPILHRDIKPANLKLTPQGEIILLDFGLAKGTAGQTSSVMTSRSVFGFTPNFAPLEQIQGTGTGPRSDLYSLAATLYYLMTGAIPPDALTRITEVANGQPDPLRAADEVNPEIPSEIAQLLMRTMAHNRDQRPATAAEMRALLREASPSLALASEAERNGDERKDISRAKTILPSTLVEPADTQDIPAVETAASPTIATPTARQLVSELETAPDEESQLPAKPERKVSRMKWAAASVAALLVVAFSYVAISGYFSNNKTDVNGAAKLATKDAGANTAPLTAILQQSVAAPDDSEIVTTTDASGVKTETRTFKSHSHVSKVVVTTVNGKQTARVYSLSGGEQDLAEAQIPTALEASGDALALAAGFIKMKTDQDPKVASRKTTAPVKGSIQKPAAQTKIDPKLLSNVPAQNIPFQNRVSGQKESQSRRVGSENVIPINQTAEGAKKTSKNPQ